MPDGWLELPLSALLDDNYRPLVAEHVEALATKIGREGFRTEHGVPVVRPAAQTTKLGRNSYWIVSGHHRVAALRRLGWERVPCKVIAAGELAALARSVESNSARLDAPLIDEAAAFGRLAAGGMRAEDIATEIGRSVGYVTRRLAILALDPAVQHVAGAYGFAWAEALLPLGPAYQRQAARALDHGPISLAAFRRVVERVAKREASETAAQAALLDGFELQIEQWTARAKAEEAIADDGLERVLGTYEACRMFGWRRSQVREWQRLGIFPDPELTVDRRPAWFASTLRDWAKNGKEHNV